MSTYRTKHPYSFNSEFLLPMIAIMLILLSIFIINLFSASDRRQQPILDPIIANGTGVPSFFNAVEYTVFTSKSS